MCLAVEASPEWGLCHQYMKRLRIWYSFSPSIQLKRSKVNRIFLLNSCIYFRPFLHLQVHFLSSELLNLFIFNLPEAASCCIPVSWHKEVNKFFWRGTSHFKSLKDITQKRVYQLWLFPWARHQPCSQISYSSSLTRYNWRQNLSTGS